MVVHEFIKPNYYNGPQRWQQKYANNIMIIKTKITVARFFAMGHFPLKINVSFG